MPYESSKSTAPNVRRFSLFPRPLNQALTQLIKPQCRKHGFAESRILTEWERVVGAELAACSQPQKLTGGRGQGGGTLHVVVAGARALELQYLQPVILERIATYFGYAAVARLRFIQSHHLFSPSAPPAPSAPQKPGPWQDLASGCEDAQMRAALVSLAQALSGVEN